MYSFSHRVLQSDEPLPADANLSGAMWFNHYPFRAVRFETERDRVVTQGHDVYFLIQSGYLGRRWVSRFVVHVRGSDLVVEDVTP
jgi:hypothetical protein